MARPKIYRDSMVVALNTRDSRTRLNQNSERRAVVLAIIDNDGRMSFAGLDQHFGFSVRSTVISLIGKGWLEVVQ